MNVGEWKKFDARFPGIIDPDKRSFEVGDIVASGYDNVYIVTTLLDYRSDKVVVQPITGKTPKLVPTREWRKVFDQPIYLAAVAILRKEIQATYSSYAKRSLFAGLSDIAAANLTETDVLSMKSDDLSYWRRLGLCLEFSGRTLVWKHLRPNDDNKGVWLGNLGAPYGVGVRTLTPLAMATAGPIGAIKDWSHQSRNSCHVAGFWADRVFKASCHPEDSGVFYVPLSTLAGVYKVASRTVFFGGEVELDLELIEGEDVLQYIGPG